MTSRHVVLPLSIEQVADLGLAPGFYEAVGYVRRGGDDRPAVEVPAVETLTVPVKWLHALESAPLRNHQDITALPW
ncbi:hypothetical protein AB6813_19860 [bacterium RCC_150]